MKRALVLGGSGGLAQALIHELLTSNWEVDLVSRSSKNTIWDETLTSALRVGTARFFSIENSYSEFTFPNNYDAVFQTQAIFNPRPLVDMAYSDISTEISVGLTEQIQLTQRFLQLFPSGKGMKRNICFIGSTSAYAGFKNTSVYCAVKHGLLGFIRAMNDELSNSDDRFWLLSMGTMNTNMGQKVTGQDSSTYLNATDVAKRIVDIVSSDSNIFEPEVIMRRRTVRFLQG